MSETQSPVDEAFLRDFKDMQRKIADISNAAVNGSQLAPGDIVLGGPTRTGCLLCDGSLVSRSDQAGIFLVWGTTFGVGDGSTTFNLPDFRSYVPGGAGAGGFVLGTPTGAAAVTLTAAQSGLPAHTHPGGGTITSGAEAAHTHSGTTGAGSAHSHGAAAGSFIETGAVGNLAVGGPANFNTHSATATEAAHTHPFTTGAGSSHTHSVTDPTTGASTAANAAAAHSIVQPTLPINFWIKT